MTQIVPFRSQTTLCHSVSRRSGLPERPRLVSFGSSAAGAMSPDDLGRAAILFRQAIEFAESLPGSGDWPNGVLDFFKRVFGLDRKQIESVQQVLAKLAEDPAMVGSCEIERGANNRKVATLVKRGSTVYRFEKREIQSAEFMSFSDFMQQRLAGQQKVVLFITGWTKPPVSYFQQHRDYQNFFPANAPEQWPQIAEKLYANMVKTDLERLLAILKKEKQDFNPATDLAVVYGVAKQGVDRAVEDLFHKKLGVTCIGLSCYDWAEPSPVGYLEDEAGKPPVYLAKDPKEFAKLAFDHSQHVLLVGGRAFAAAALEQPESEDDAAHKVIPFDVMASRDINVPGIVDLGDGGAQIVNACEVRKIMPGGDMREWPVIKRSSNIHDLPLHLWAALELLQKQLDALSIRRALS